MVPLKLQAEVFKLSPRVLTSSLSGLSLKKKKKVLSPSFCIPSPPPRQSPGSPAKDAPVQCLLQHL